MSKYQGQIVANSLATEEDKEFMARFMSKGGAFHQDVTAFDNDGVLEIDAESDSEFVEQSLRAFNKQWKNKVKSLYIVRVDNSVITASYSFDWGEGLETEKHK